VKIAVDAMGSEGAPAIEVQGAIEAAEKFDLEVVLVGDKSLIEHELSKHRSYPKNISIEHAPEVISMGESPFESVRKKKNSSINVAVNLAKKKKVDAIVSAGNTGAVVCATSLFLRLLEGVNKPGIMVPYPGIKGPIVMLDGGANINPTPGDLLAYGIMGDVYSREIMKKPSPKIGLLNIGEEAIKGTELIKGSHKLLEKAGLNFVGNAEGKDIFSGDVDVIVCDGFIGNVVLKVAESVGFTLAQFMKREIKKSAMLKVGALMCLPAFRKLKKELDYAEYGGAPLLGIDGICIICHGRSSPKAIKNAIRVAGEFVDHQITEHFAEALKRVKKLEVKNV
jgi:glycerol-3-phosphate acyltransferase PlsX